MMNSDCRTSQEKFRRLFKNPLVTVEFFNSHRQRDTLSVVMSRLSATVRIVIHSRSRAMASASYSVSPESIGDPSGGPAGRKRAIPHAGEPDLKFKNPPNQPPGQPNVHPSARQHNSLAGREVNVARIYRPSVRTRQPFAEEAGSIVFIGINSKASHKRRERGRARAVRILVESEIGD